MRLRKVLLGIAVVANVIGPALAFSQTPLPGATSPSGAIFDRFRGATTRQLPPVPPRPAPAPQATWVPDRIVQVPGVDTPVFVPGHWERSLSDHEVYTPALPGRTPNGDTINFPAGARPPATERQAP